MLREISFLITNAFSWSKNKIYSDHVHTREQPSVFEYFYTLLPTSSQTYVVV